MEPGFFFSYWRPWDEDSSLINSWGNYLRDTSLVDYAARSFERFTKEASQDIVNAINNASIEASINTALLISKTEEVRQELSFINRKIDMVIEQQRMAQLTLLGITDILKIPDSEKERQHCITLGIKFLSNASKDSDLYADALSWFHKAEQLQPQDYFVLHRLGMIYLYADSHIDIEKAREYFVKAGKYASIESEDDAKRIVNILSNDINQSYTAISSSPSAIASLASDSYCQAALAYYILGDFENAVQAQKKAFMLVDSSKNAFYYIKYLCRNNATEDVETQLSSAVTRYPELLEAFFADLDIISFSFVQEYVTKLLEEENNKTAYYLARLSDSSFQYDKDLVPKLSSAESFSEKKRLNGLAETRVGSKQPIYTCADEAIDETSHIQVIVDHEGIVVFSYQTIIDHLSDQMGRLGATEFTISQFREGLARVSFFPGRMSGYLDEKGELAIPAKYNYARDFSEGLAFVNSQGRQMFIDKQGNIQREFQEDETINDISEGTTCLCTIEIEDNESYRQCMLFPKEHISENYVDKCFYYEEIIPEMHAGYVLFEPISGYGVCVFTKDGEDLPLSYKILKQYESCKLLDNNRKESKLHVINVPDDYPEGTFLFAPTKENPTTLPFFINRDGAIKTVSEILEKGKVVRPEVWVKSRRRSYDESINTMIRMGLISSAHNDYQYSIDCGKYYNLVITLNCCQASDLVSHSFDEIKDFINSYKYGDIFHSKITRSKDLPEAQKRSENVPINKSLEKPKELVTKKAEIELDDALLEAPAKIYVSYLIQVLRVTNSMQQVRSRGYYIVTESEVEKSFEEMLSDEKYKKLLHLRGEKNAIEISPDKIESLLLKKGIFIKNEQSNDGSYQMPTISTEQAQDIIDGKLSINDITKSNKSETTKKGCYIATCIYGSYDCPEVWTLRRYRDQVLRKSAAGRLFIRVYYATSPTLVRWFGDIALFRSINRNILDKWISTLRIKGFSGAPYRD